MNRYDELLALIANPTDDCIDWPHGRDKYGYAVVWHQGKVLRGHRIVCELTYGPPPAGKRIHAAHSCNRAICVNPRHLRWATSSENQRDRWTTPTGDKALAEVRRYLNTGEVAA